MATLDFSELGSKPVGETFEGLVRLIGERLGFTVSWTGRGADQGRDLMFVETRSGRIGSTSVRWLVNCKDNSKTNQSVTEQDVGSIHDKVLQHGCHGFLLATTTTVGTALKAKMDALANHPQTPVQTKVWDRFELTSMLLRDEFADLLRQFFPKEQAKNASIEIDAARAKIEASVPRVVVGALRKHLVPYAERMNSLSGANVWPRDPDQQEVIDWLSPRIVGRAPRAPLNKRFRELGFDAFLAFMDQLIRAFPHDAYRHALFYAQEETDSGRIFNLIHVLREFDGFDDDLELPIAARADAETLYELYGDFVVESLSEDYFWRNHTLWEIETFHDATEIQSIEVDELELIGGEGVGFNALVQFDVIGSTDHIGYSDSDRKTFTYYVTGYLEAPLRAAVDEVRFKR